MHFSTVFALAFPVVTFASAIPRQSGSCNTGQLNCCNSVQDARTVPSNLLGGLLGIGLGAITGQVGVNCTPISVLGLGGNSCSAQPACCSGNQFNSLITLACTPINLNL